MITPTNELSLSNSDFDATEATHPALLNNAQFGRLDELLEQIGSRASAEFIDGCFAAWICSGHHNLPFDLLPSMVGKGCVPDDAEQAKELLILLMRHWLNAQARLALIDDESGMSYAPLLFKDDDGVMQGNDWAEGFMFGATVSGVDWDELVHNEAYAEFMLPIMVLAFEHHPDPDMPPLDPMDADLREKTLEALPLCVAGIRDYFSSPGYTHVPVRREGPKIGRNEPCPCGNGKKYKRCCGANTPE